MAKKKIKEKSTIEFKFPDVGEGIAEGEVVEWLVKEGAKVKLDQPIAKVETDKAVVELPSPSSGVIRRLHFKKGAVVKVGQTLVTIEVIGAQKEQLQKKNAVVGELKEAGDEEDIFARAKKKFNVAGAKAGISVVGEGEEKLVRPSVEKKYDMYGYVKRIPLKGVRKIIARHMVESVSKAAHVTHMDEADVTELVKVKENEKLAAEKRGVKLTFLPYIIKAVVKALKTHLYLNAVLDEETQEIILKEYYNIGIAVSTNDGLLVPVIKGADEKNILEIAKEILKLRDAAVRRKLDLSDLKGGTFTITNIGSVGGLFATPIINYPESAILALGRIYKKQVVVDDKILIRDVLPLSLTFDHRILDGAEAAGFVTDIINYLGNPRLILDAKK